MKNLGKLEINPAKVIRNEDLITLRGGYDDWYCQCANAWDEGAFTWDPPSHTFSWWDCSLVYEWRGIMESFGHTTLSCSVAK